MTRLIIPKIMSISPSIANMPPPILKPSKTPPVIINPPIKSARKPVI